MTPLAIAFLPLTDSAVLVAAKEMGFAEAQGIDLTLVRSTSWATVRDRLVFGQVQAAHMLAPLAVAVTLGLSQHATPLAAPFKLNVNGNALTLSVEFAAALDPAPRNRIADPVATAHDLAAAIGLHRRKPIIGIVHRFSSHALMLRYWLAFAGIDPDRDVVLRVLPPSLMVEAMCGGEIDGFIAGEPWSSLAVAQGLGEIVSVGTNIWQRGVEKLLAFREAWLEANGDTVDALLRALALAAAWCDDPANRSALADLLAREEYVGQPAELILPALTGRLVLHPAGEPVAVPDFLLFEREAANFPWRSQGLWIYSQFVRWKMIEPNEAHAHAASGVFRSDIYRRALAGSGVAMPAASSKVEGALSSPLAVGSSLRPLTLGPDSFFDGRIFDPADVDSYLAAFARY
ncbi:MAG: CmpA/NrtA family ABC transporter substrate-binding protein [Sphingomicrobium sp.]